MVNQEWTKQNLWKTAFKIFTWSILEHFVPNVFCKSLGNLGNLKNNINISLPEIRTDHKQTEPAKSVKNKNIKPQPKTTGCCRKECSFIFTFTFAPILLTKVRFFNNCTNISNNYF